MKNNWRYKKIDKGYFLAVNTCGVCGSEYSNGNPAASLYCPECAAKIKREKTAERVRRHRQKQGQPQGGAK
jgi:predicted RNA-binding Zn-ribbon protein involved in translation (DUF1610 family)